MTGGNHKTLDLSSEEIALAFSDQHWAADFPPILTVEEAAAMLRVPKQTVYDWSSRGLLRGCARRVGRHLRIWRDRLIDRCFNDGLANP